MSKDNTTVTHSHSGEKELTRRLGLMSAIVLGVGRGFLLRSEESLEQLEQL